MAMAPCRECGKEVSTTAKTCPHCGTQWPANKAALIGQGMQSCGCIMTLLITIPILIFLFMLF